LKNPTVARSYAEALYEVAEKKGVQAQVEDSIGALEGTFNEVPLLRDFLASPTIDAARKKATLRKALKDQVHPIFMNFLMVLVDKRRQRMLADVAEQYRNLLDERQGRLHVQVTVARAQDERARAELPQQLSKALGRDVVPHVTVNPEILGGIIVRYGDRVLDGSLRRRLISMRRRLIESGLPTNR
jgi:F-type H+-transporting ATPase subunit delta